ncbi:hypothetical protein PM082_004162 [Marasmius tenuissimus]|nr:hypothetical protein PM082_004162 [Marasmius tenuissimus]
MLALLDKNMGQGRRKNRLELATGVPTSPRLHKGYMFAPDGLELLAITNQHELPSLMRFEHDTLLPGLEAVAATNDTVLRKHVGGRRKSS